MTSRTIRHALVAGAFAAVTALYMGGAIADCAGTIMGGPGDGTSGGIWLNWLYQQLGAGPWPTHSPYTAAPFGEEVWRAHFVTAAMIQFPMWALTSIAGPVCAWNLMVFLGFVASALIGYGFLSWLTGSVSAGIFAGYAYAFSPFHMFKAEGHISYLHSFLFLALLWAFTALWAKPSFRRAALLGLCTALLPYTDGYYVLLGGVTIGTLGVATLVCWSRQWSKHALTPNRLKMFAVSGAIALVLLVPLGSIWLLNSSEISASVARSPGEVNTYSSRPYEFVLPARTHPVFSQWVGGWQDRHLHLSNYSEQTLYLGWSVILLSIAFFVSVLWGKSPGKLVKIPGLNSSFFAVILAAVGSVTMLFSAPPEIHLGSLAIPFPSGFLYERIQFWRVFARFFLVTHAAFVVLAGLGLATLTSRCKPRYRSATTFVLVGVLAFEMLTVPPRREWSYREAPREYSWLASQTGVEILAEYPIVRPPSGEAYRYLTYQVVHGKRMINSSQLGDRYQALRDGLTGLGDPQTIPALRALGVDTVVVHSELYPDLDPEKSPPGMLFQASFPNTLIYRMENGPLGIATVATGSGFYQPELRGWDSFRWMGERGVISFFRIDKTVKRAVVRFRAESASGPRRLLISQAGVVVWQGDITSNDVEFEADLEGKIVLITDPGAEKVIGDDPRRISIGLSRLSVQGLTT